MKYIEATQQEIVYHRFNNIPVEEIKSFEELSQLSKGTEVAILYNAMMRIGIIYSKEKDYILIDDEIKIITVYPSSFEHSNYIYKIL